MKRNKIPLGTYTDPPCAVIHQINNIFISNNSGNGMLIKNTIRLK